MVHRSTTFFEKLIPWIALILLMQGVATSIDALSVGFTIADYGFLIGIGIEIFVSGIL